MITITQFYVEKAKARIAEKEGKIPSNYKMAQLLGISQPYMTRLMAPNSKHEIGDDVAVKLAELAGVPAAEIISKIHLKRAEEADNPKLLNFWKQISELAKNGALAGVLGAFLVGGQFATYSPTAEAKTPVNSIASAEKGRICFILC